MTDRTAGAAHDVQDEPVAAGMQEQINHAQTSLVPGRLRRRQPLWTNRERTIWTSVALSDGACRVQLVGELDAVALQPFRAALDAAHEAASGQGYDSVILDLARARSASPVSLALLSAGRRYLSHRGLRTVLLDVPPPLQQALAAAHVDSLYEFASSDQVPDGPTPTRRRR